MLIRSVDVFAASGAITAAAVATTTVTQLPLLYFNLKLLFNVQMIRVSVINNHIGRKTKAKNPRNSLRHTHTHGLCLQNFVLITTVSNIYLKNNI